MSAPFRYYLRVRYAECDAQKVVFNARYGAFVDLGFTEFLRALGYGEALADGASTSSWYARRSNGKHPRVMTR